MLQDSHKADRSEQKNIWRCANAQSESPRCDLGRERVPNSEFVISKNIAERIADFQTIAVFNQSKLLETFHQHIDSLASCTNHLRQSLLTDSGGRIKLPRLSQEEEDPG